MATETRVVGQAAIDDLVAQAMLPIAQRLLAEAAALPEAEVRDWARQYDPGALAFFENNEQYLRDECLKTKYRRERGVRIGRKLNDARERAR